MCILIGGLGYLPLPGRVHGLESLSCGEIIGTGSRWQIPCIGDYNDCIQTDTLHFITMYMTG